MYQNRKQSEAEVKNRKPFTIETLINESVFIFWTVFVISLVVFTVWAQLEFGFLTELWNFVRR